MADINTLIETIGDALAVDSDVASWCDSYYDTALTVYENCDSRDDPPPSACPMVVMSPMEKHAGMALKEKQHGIGVSVVVYDENKETSDAGVIRFVGGRRVEALRKLVLASITGNTPSNIHLMNVDIVYDTIEQFPFVTAAMALIFEETQILGTTPYE